ncbi:outer membrane beta-barrel protein [Chitinophaga agrisoli]|uniref:Outer membrane beta-barrel protein n=1 Tax=Chitinophaga agrisoli TaxID=2607653 RepID=A0A5B2VT75_9BACT|nr:outer membrane beta-barrel protein [Chitinophaga agrisoli]KAA2241522.1 outer membrane beta-barrel protein [Chitinophaga agrisoli]
MTLQVTIKQAEKALGVYGRSIYTRLGITQTTYSSWKTGRNKSARIDLHGKFQSEYGIDLKASQRKGELVISDKEQFAKRCKKRHAACVMIMAIAIAFFTPVQAQSINAGLRVAGNAPLKGGELILQNPPDDYRPYELRERIGFSVGGFAEINLTRHFAIQPEIGYNRVQWELMDAQSRQPRPFIYTNNYWEIPVLLKYKLSGFGICVGAKMDILASSSAVEPAGEGLGTRIGYPDTDKDFKTRNPVFGVIGLEYTMRRPGIGFSLRYLHGFDDVFTADNSLILAAPFKQVKSRQLQFGMHWRFGRDKSRQ